MARSAGLVPVSRHDSQPGRVADSNAASGRAGSEPWLRVTDTVTDRDLDLNLKLNLALTRSLRRAAFGGPEPCSHVGVETTSSIAGVVT